MSIELQQLRGFLAVAGEGSFTAAAKKTFRTQPTVSQQVANLEAELDVKLFDRIGKRRVRLTKAGEVLREISSPLVASIEQMTSLFQERLTGEVMSPLRIAARPTTIQYVLPTLIERFRQGHPKAPITILSRDREAVVDLVKKGEVDLGIVSLARVPAGLSYEPFGSYPRALVGPKDHPLVKKRSIGVEDLEECPLILPPRGSHTREIIDQTFLAKGLRPSVALEVQGTEAALIYVAMGLGLSIVTLYEPFPKGHQLLRFRTLSFLPQAERGWLWRTRATLSAAAEGLKRIAGHST